MIDFHSHILPGVDDGARDVETSLALLTEEKKQGVDTVILTPHFYPATDNISNFIEITNKAYNFLSSSIDNISFPNIILGAEVALSYNLPKLTNIEKLCIQGTDLILVELPYKTYNEWILDSLFELSARGLTPVIAHFERYIKYDFFKTLYEKILAMNFDIQINSTFIFDKDERKFFKSLLKQNIVPILGSDTHNLENRFIHLKHANHYIKKKYKDNILNKINNKPYELLKLHKK